MTAVSGTKSALRIAISIIMGVFLLIIATPKAHAASTIQATFLGPNGETGAIHYNFHKSTGGDTAGVTNSSGIMSQSLPAGLYTLTVTAPTQIPFLGDMLLDNLNFADSATIKMGTFYFRHDDPTTPENEAQTGGLGSGTFPGECSLQGNPQIYNLEPLDETHRGFAYAGHEIGVKIFSDQPGYTAVADFSIMEGQSPGTTLVSGVDNGDGTYTFPHILGNTSLVPTFAPITVKLTDGSASTSERCLGTITNMDIRLFVPALGGDTTILSELPSFRNGINYTLNFGGVVRVVFHGPIDATDPLIAGFFSEVIQSVHYDVGTFGMSLETLSHIHLSNTTITMFNLPYTFTPEITRDNQPAGSVVSNVQYDANARTLTFDTSHYSTYKALPTVKINTPENSSTTSASSITIDGAVNDPAATATFALNGGDASSLSLSGGGVFTKHADLQMGENTITFAASNSFGDGTPVTLKVTRVEPSVDNGSTNQTLQTLPVTGTNSAIMLFFMFLLSFGVVLYVKGQRGKA